MVRYRIELIGIVFIALVVATIRNHILTLRNDNVRVPHLVSSTLDRLATQASLHTQGNDSEPWISMVQLRDDVLRDEFSAKRRDGIWKRVQAIVERNANVRSSVREGRAGEISRVWEWIGSMPALEDTWSGGRRESGRKWDDSRPEYARTADQGTSPVGIEPRKWDEGRPLY